MTAADTLRAMRACPEAITWAESHGGDLAALWRDCRHGDWLLWYAAKGGAPLPALVRAAAACAETVLPHAGGARGACEAAIAAARAWAEAPSDETRAAASAAVYAASAAPYAAASAAASAASAAASAAAYAAYAASAAAYAANAAVRAAAIAIAADLVRRELAEWAREAGLA